MLRVDTFHYYDHNVYGNYGLRSRVRIYDAKDGVVMVLSELYEKPDTTIVDSLEELAAELRQTYNLDAETTRWILHLSAGRSGAEEQGHVWEEVTYNWLGGELPFAPVRTAIPSEQMEILVGDDLAYLGGVEAD